MTRQLEQIAKGALDPEEFWHAWARGEGVTVDLFGPGWDFWDAAQRPIEAVRAEINLADRAGATSEAQR